MRRPLAALTIALALSACDSLTGSIDPDAPQALAYQLIPSGDPEVPLGILLTWEPPKNPGAVSYDVYARSSQGERWQLRATTTSLSFHDAGVPQLQYLVASLDDRGEEMGRSRELTVDERNRVGMPTGLRSTSLDSAVHLAWDPAAAIDAPRLDYYRVYSAPYSAQTARCSATQWAFEGSTVSDAFVATRLANGASRCFAVSAVSRDGHESAWSATRVDTPRPDARSVVIDAVEARAQSAVFFFLEPGSRRFGIVADTSRHDGDVVVERHADGTLWLRTLRAGVGVQVLGTSPVADLTAIDRAPSTGYAAEAVKAVAGFGYAFQLTQADGVHYGALRVVHVSTDFVLVDWSYQPAAGNPELSVGVAR